MRRTANLGCALAETPAATALIDLGGDAGPRTVSYAEIERHSDAVARLLLRRGLMRGERVAILGANRAEYLTAYFGILRAGLVAVPLNHKLPPATAAFVLEDCDAKLAICDAERRALVPDSLPCIAPHLHLSRGAGEVAARSAAGEGPARSEFGDSPARNAPAEGPPPNTFTPVVPAPDEPAMFLYTSGSTGQPKGVVLSHRSHLWVLEMRTAEPAPPARRILVAAPLYHMNALSMCQAALATGQTVVLTPTFTPASFIDAAARYRVHALTGVPTMLAMMLRERRLMDAADLTAVQAIRVGSAPLSPALVEAMRAAFPRAALTNGYGTTEAGPIVFDRHPDGLPQPPLSVGAAHPAVDLRLRRNGRIVTDEGVLEMRCPALMNGYHKRPDLTRKVMTDDGYYITGDIFRRDADGFFFFTGRADDMFVCGGENIYPREVEIMLETHPAIAQAVVVPVPDELKGHKPVAFVTLRADSGAALTEDDIRRFALAAAPAYLHPRRVWFLDQMPLAGTNKIDRRRLSELALEHLP